MQGVSFIKKGLKILNVTEPPSRTFCTNTHHHPIPLIIDAFQSCFHWLLTDGDAVRRNVFQPSIQDQKSFPPVSFLFIQSSMRMISTRSVGSLTVGIKIDCAWRCSRNKPVRRNAVTRVQSSPGSSTEHFDWKGLKIQGNRKNWHPESVRSRAKIWNLQHQRKVDLRRK